MSRFLSPLLPLLLHLLLVLRSVGGGYLGEYPDGCDTAAAAVCEYEDLKCRIFTGPAGDSEVRASHHYRCMLGYVCMARVRGA